MMPFQFQPMLSRIAGSNKVAGRVAAGPSVTRAPESPPHCFLESYQMTTTTAGQSMPMSSADFAAFGSEELAYVKPVTIDDEPRFAVHAADGTALTVAPSRDVAFAVVRQNEMEPVSVH